MQKLRKQRQWCFGKLQRIIYTLLRTLHLVEGPRRYKHLFDCINKHKPHLLMEIGVWKGRHALQMIETAKKYWPADKIEYYGFDLFEDINKQKITGEFAKKPPFYHKVKKRLQKTDVKIILHKGDTVQIFPSVINNLPKMDFIFIDGGHSIETVQNDWKYSKELMHDKTVLIFDDYWNREDAGCKKIVDSIDKKEFSVEIMEPADKFKKDWGILSINCVKIMKRIDTV